MENKFEIDIKGLVLFVLRKTLYIILSAVICAGIGFIYAKSLTPLYTASAKLYVNNYNERAKVDQTRTTGSDMATSQALVRTYLEFLKSSKVLDSAAEQLGWRYTGEMIGSMMTAQPANGTEVFNIRITADDPKVAKAIANIIADKAPEIIQSYVEGSSVKVVDYAKEPKIRAFPSYKKYVMQGGIVGGVIAFVIIALLFIFNSRIKGKDDLNSLFKVPVIGEIPNFYQIAEGGYGSGYYKSYKPYRQANEGRAQTSDDKKIKKQ